MGRIIEGRPRGEGHSVGIVVSQFNRGITERLLQGALRALKASGVSEEQIDVLWVPGAFELPQAARWLCQCGRYDGVLPLGCIIRGETPHFDYICQSVSSGLMELSLDSSIPVVFGVLTVDTPEQAATRSTAERNKGSEAAETLLCLIDGIQQLAGS